MLKDNVNKVEKFYDDFSKNYEETHSSRFVDRIFENLLLKYLPKKSHLNILDCGGGIGRFSIPLLKKGHSLVLNDISEEMIKKAKEISSRENLKDIIFYKEPASNMKNQKDNRFDVVLLMNGVLDYCQKHKKALNEVGRVLKKDGIVIGTVNNRFVYATTNTILQGKRVDKFEKSFKTGDKYSSNLNKKLKTHDFTLEELKKDLTSKGFEIIDILGPTNLLRKWEYEKVAEKTDKKKLLDLQLKFASKKEYINNSSDFFFVCKKVD